MTSETMKKLIAESEAKRQYYLRHAEARRAYQRAYYHRHKDTPAYQAYHREYMAGYAENPDTKAAYYQAHRDAILARQRARYAARKAAKLQQQEKTIPCE